jgi:hypothetical protein
MRLTGETAKQTKRVQRILLRADSFSDELLLTRIYELLTPQSTGGFIAVVEDGKKTLIWKAETPRKESLSG